MRQDLLIVFVGTLVALLVRPYVSRTTGLSL